MKSRPSTRDRYDLALTHQVIELAKQRSVDIVMYGQETAGGFLDSRAKYDLQGACSCYVSPLPPWAGFGLAQHECLSAGVPLAGLIWGDLEEELPAPYPALTETLDDLAEAVERLCTEQSFAEALSEAGLAYIAQHRTKTQTERSIQRFLGEVRTS
jgi:glycosyltransferase involved in cell wall biosynthesis